MRKTTAFLFIASTLFVACSKDNGCTNVPTTSEDLILQHYNSAHGITATKDKSGIYYHIIDSGGSKKPTKDSRLFVTYKGKKMDDIIFDQQTNPGATGFVLSSLVKAWQIVVPKIGKKGKVMITTPSSLAYGCLGSPNPLDSSKSIPPNAPLYFEIELEDFLN